MRTSSHGKADESPDALAHALVQHTFEVLHECLATLTKIEVPRAHEKYLTVWRAEIGLEQKGHHYGLYGELAAPPVREGPDSHARTV